MTNGTPETPTTLESRPLDESDLMAWMRLDALGYAGRRTAWRALLHFGHPAALFAQSTNTLRQLYGIDFASAVCAPPNPALHQAAQAAAEWAGRGQAEGVRRHLVTLADPAYPPAFCSLADPPMLLYIEGRLDLVTHSALAIVGSRQPSPQGRENARFFAAALAEAGWTIVSGLASGIDAEAHQAALPSDASTIAVIGTGIDVIYPRQHQRLSAQIARHGALVSEWPLGTVARPAHFPQRNRLIAALSQAVLIVEATLRSGSLITARLANDMGRDVLAVPGSIHSPLARGCHALIKQGAKLVENVEDIVQELLPLGCPDGQIATRASKKNKADQTAAQQPLFDRKFDRNVPDTAASHLLGLMGHDPVTLDTLTHRSGLHAGAVAASLMQLEIDGWVALQAGRYQRIDVPSNASPKQT